MNRIDERTTTAEAAKYFRGEVLEMMPDVPKDRLCDMVDDYVYYQKTSVTRDEADRVTEETCRKK